MVIREWGRRRIVVQATCAAATWAASSTRRERMVGEQAIAARLRHPLGRPVRAPRGRAEPAAGGRAARAGADLRCCSTSLSAAWRDALRVFTGVPFAGVGGILALWLRDSRSASRPAWGSSPSPASSVLGDLVLVSYIRQLIGRGMALRRGDREAVRTRLRPVLMTAWWPAWASCRWRSTPASAPRCSARWPPSSSAASLDTLLTLVVLPVLYAELAGRGVRRREA